MAIRTLRFIRRNPLAFTAILVITSGLQLWSFGNSPTASAAPTTTQLTLPTGLVSATDMSVSADGTRLVLISGTSGVNPIKHKIYTSADSGASWVETTPATLLQTNLYTPASVASSSDGQKVVITTLNAGFIYLSNDYGATWTSKDFNSFKSGCNNQLYFANHGKSNPETGGLEMSPDGTLIAFGVNYSTCMFVSTDSGANFSKITLPVTLDKQGALRISKNQNAIWFAKSNTGGSIPAGGLWKLDTTNWQWSGNYSGTVGLPRGLTGSQDGSILYTAGGAGYSGTAANNFLGVVYRSTDAGANFLPLAGTSKNWMGIRSSGDGTKLIGWDTSNLIHISEDSGATWSVQHNPGVAIINSQYVGSVEFSSDGTKAYMTMGFPSGSTPTTAAYRYSFPTPSTTTLTTQNTSVVYGTTNTFTATINSNTATGTVNFRNGISSIGCDAATVTAGVATCTSWKPNVGTYSNITAIYSGDGNFGGSTSDSVSFSATQADLTITASSPTVTYGTTAPTITAAYSGLVNSEASSVVTGLSCTSLYTTTSSVGSLPATSCSGGTNSNYLISYVDGAVTINKATPIMNTWNSNWRSRTYGNGTFNLDLATANVAGTFTYTSGSPSVISLNGRTATVAGAGTSVVTASFTPTDTTNYESTVSASLTFNVLKNTPVLTWNNVSKSMGDASFTLTPPTSTTPGTFTYTSATLGVISLNGDIATVSGMGTSVITANFTPTDTNNYGVTTKTMTVTVNAIAQTITQTSVSPTSPVKSETYTPMATASSSLTVAISISSGSSSVCSISTGVVSFNAVGNCVIQYNQSGDASYSAAPQVTETLTIGKATPTFTWSDASKTFGDSTFTVTAPTVTGSIGGSFSYSSADTSVISVSSSTFTVVGTGSSVITASFSPTDSTNYNSATTSMTITVGVASQTITRTSTSPTSPIKSGAYTPTASSSSLLSVAITVASESSSICSIALGVVTFNSAGSCVIQYNQSGNTNYSAAAQVTETLTIGKATPTLFAWNDVSKAFENGDFTLTAPTVTGSLDGTFTYASGTPTVISLNGSLATVAGAGTAVITATFNPTDSTNYNSATTTMTVTVAKVSPRFSTVNVSKTFGAAPFSLSYPYVFRVLTGTFSFSSADTSVITVNGRVATVVGVGTSVITATFTPDDTNNYITGATTTFSVTVAQGAQNVALVLNSTSVTYESTLSLTTTGGSGSGTNSFVVDSGPCTISGSTLTPTATGTCLVTATKVANGNYLAASSVSTAITVNPKALTISGLTGVNKEFDGGVAGSITGTPTLVGVVGSDDVLLLGTPVFTFASANAANGITLTASGYTLTGTTAGNYTLTQPTVTANITAKAARVAATNTTVAFGAPVTSGFTTSGLISPDALGSASYTYTGTGTSTPPTAVGVYTVTPSNAVMSTGTIGNYTISYDAATLTILAKYTTTYNANGGTVLGGATSNVDFVVGDNALTLPTPTRANYTFTGWYTLQTNGVQVSGAYTPTASSTLWAHWVQNSLYGMGANTRLFSLTTFSGAGNTYSVSAAGGTIGIEYLADALPAGTVIDGYLLTDTSTATTLIGANNNYVMSLVLAWVALDGTVPTTATNKAIIMTITNSAIKKGSKIYSVIGSTVTPLGVAASDGSAVISITDDPQIIIAITKPDAPTGVSATTGGNAVSTVSWTAPANDGGSSITSYTAVSNAGQSCTTSATSCQVTGLANGTSYTFTVTALNSIGTSDTSTASVAITPSAPAPVQAPVVVPSVVITPAVVSIPVVMITPTLTSLTFVENATKNGGKLVWAGTNIESVLYTGNADAYPTPFNYGVFTLSWDGTLVNMVAGVTYTMKLEVRSSTGGSASKTIEYTIAKPVVDTTAADAALKAAQEKAAAEKKAAEEAAAAALKIAQDKALVDAKAAADAAALKIAQEKAVADAKAAADATALKVAQDKAAAEAKAAALKIAQDKAAAEAKAAEEAAALKVAQDKAAADAAALVIAKKTPVLNLFSSYSTAKYTASQMAKMKKLTMKLEPTTTLKCVGYINSKGTTATKAKATALAQAKATCASAKKLNPNITTVATTAALTKATKPLVGASNTKAKYRVDLFAYKG
jgi:uncharacterized repeat protein (TIGR02543 family)